MLVEPPITKGCLVLFYILKLSIRNLHYFGDTMHELQHATMCSNVPPQHPNSLAAI